MRLTPQQVVALWKAATSEIPARFALGSAQHESDLDAGELTPNDAGSGRNSDGLYQLDTAEKLAALRPDADLTDPTDNTNVYATVATARLALIKVAAGLTGAASADLPSDVWAYLAMAHNLGTAAALSTIRSHGLDWAAYKQRNSGAVWTADDEAKNARHVAGTPTGAATFCDKGYGDDVISGGRYWTDDLDAVASSGNASPSTGFGLRFLVMILAGAALWPVVKPLLKEVF